MVNQWGRDGNFSSSSSRSGAGGVIIAALVALILGAGGGYVGARFLSGVSSSDIAARDNKIAELNKTLSEMQFDSQGADKDKSALQAQVKQLQQQVDSLKRTKASLQQFANQKASEVSEDAQAEIAALKQTIEQAGDVSGKLNRAQKSLKVSELQIIELEKTVSDQKAEIGRLQDSIDKQADKANPAIVLLQGQKTALEAQLAEAKQAAGDVANLKSRIAALEEQLAKRADDADAEARQQIAALQKQRGALQARLDQALKSAVDADELTKKIAALQEQRDALQAKLDAASKAAGDAAEQAKKLASLQQQLDEMAESLADRDAAARDAANDLKAAQATLDKSRKQLQSLRDQNGTLAKARDDLTQQVASLNATIAKLKAAKPSVDTKPVANDTNQGNDAGLTPRERSDVEKAVADLPGFSNLSSDKQETLIGMLEKGECVTDSLKAAYGHVSPISLRSLFRDLGGRC